MTLKTNNGSVVCRIIATACLSVLSLGVSAQTAAESGATSGHQEDSTGCTELTSLYKYHYLNKESDKALVFWRQVITKCPAASEDLYKDGESIYSDLYSITGDVAYIDSILMVLTRRTYYFNNKPSNDLHKSELLFELAGDDPAYLGLCYNILMEAAESFPDQMGCEHFVRMATAAASLYAMGIIDAEELEHAFITALGTVDYRLATGYEDCSSPDDLENMETFYRTSGAMTCAGIEALYAWKVDRDFHDTGLIGKVNAMLTEAGCTGSDLYYNVAVKIFANDRSAKNAVRLAELNVERNNIERAISYFTEAYNRDTSRLARSEVITRVAIMELERGKRQEARDRAEHAWQLNNRNARALLLIADCYAGAEFGNSFDNHTAYWVAVDYLEAALKVDPSLRKEAEGKIRAYSRLFPTREECFYRRINDEGIVFNVGGWISEVTRVRFRRE
jgi:hypothetical protein